jgi:hypothetical protein
MIALVGVAIVAVAAPVAGQRDAGRPAPDRIGDELASWLATNVPKGGRVVMAFREREQMALRLFGDADVAILPMARVDASEAPESYLWMGLRDRQLFGYRRTAWAAALVDRPTDLLALVGPHPFTPFALTAHPATAAQLGLAPATILETDGDRAEVHRVDAAAARSGAQSVPLHLSADAAAAWLDMAGDATQIDRLLAARPVVNGDAGEIASLLDRLGTAACSTPAGEGAVTLGQAGTCPD